MPQAKPISDLADKRKRDADASSDEVLTDVSVSSVTKQPGVETGKEELIKEKLDVNGSFITMELQRV